MDSLRTKWLAFKLYRLFTKEEDMLSKLFDSTKGKGFSKKVAVLFITGTLLPVLSLMGMSDEMITLLGQMSAVYLGGQALADASHNLRNGKNDG